MNCSWTRSLLSKYKGENCGGKRGYFVGGWRGIEDKSRN